MADSAGETNRIGDVLKVHERLDEWLRTWANDEGASLISQHVRGMAIKAWVDEVRGMEDELDQTRRVLDAFEGVTIGDARKALAEMALTMVRSGRLPIINLIKLWRVFEPGDGLSEVKRAVEHTIIREAWHILRAWDEAKLRESAYARDIAEISARMFPDEVKEETVS